MHRCLNEMVAVVPLVTERAWYNLAKLSRSRRRLSLYFPRINPTGKGSMKAGRGNVGGSRNSYGSSVVQVIRDKMENPLITLPRVLLFSFFFSFFFFKFFLFFPSQFPIIL